ncbi:MAG: hypothetical protein Q8R44_03395 [Novosphingobium sp.]|nr:hypothetical protein [Novosphingobium sp.]
MATANQAATPSRRRHRVWAMVALLVLAALLAAFWRPLTGYARVGSAYGAHVACSCRYAGGRSLSDCAKDFEPGMELISLSEDRKARSVTARFPLLGTATATYHEGWGCLLEPWGR